MTSATVLKVQSACRDFKDSCVLFPLKLGVHLTVVSHLFPGLLLLHSLFPDYYMARTFCDYCQLCQHSSGMGFFSVLMVMIADLWPLSVFQIQVWGKRRQQMEDDRTKKPLLQNSSCTNIHICSCEWIKLDSAARGGIMKL